MQDIRFFETLQLSTMSQMMMSRAILNRELLLSLSLSLSLSVLTAIFQVNRESWLAGVY